MGKPFSLSDMGCNLQEARGAVRRAAPVVRTMGGGWWWARAARLARLRFRRSLLPPQRPRSGGARGSFAPGHGPRAGASPPPVSELDRADAWLLRKAHETAFLSWFRNGLLASGIGVISFMQSDMGREAAYGKDGETQAETEDDHVSVEWQLSQGGRGQRVPEGHKAQGVGPKASSHVDDLLVVGMVGGARRTGGGKRTITGLGSRCPPQCWALCDPPTPFPDPVP
uniref:Transmembrane protein 160 n=1 Tax=Macaca mulatta TaxID=9544 RepID=A0A5F7ZK50_MACMU